MLSGAPAEDAVWCFLWGARACPRAGRWRRRMVRPGSRRMKAPDGASGVAADEVGATGVVSISPQCSSPAASSRGRAAPRSACPATAWAARAASATSNAATACAGPGCAGHDGARLDGLGDPGAPPRHPRRPDHLNTPATAGNSPPAPIRTKRPRAARGPLTPALRRQSRTSTPPVAQRALGDPSSPGAIATVPASLESFLFRAGNQGTSMQ